MEKSNFIRSSGTPTKFSEDEFPKITVIVACKDAASTITRTLSSIEAQDYANIQVIVIDGGSSDQTHNIIEEFRHIVDVYISGKDKGVADAHNIALLHATGDLITFLNADDFKLPGCFYFVAKKFMADASVDIVSTGLKIIDEHLTETHYYNKKEDIVVTVPNMLMKFTAFNCHFFSRSALASQPPFLNFVSDDDSRFIACDRLWMIQLAKRNPKTAFVSGAYHCYMAHANSATLSGKNWKKIRHEHIWIAKELLKTNCNHEEKNLIQTFKYRNEVLLIVLTLMEFKFETAIAFAASKVASQGWRWAANIPIVLASELHFRIKPRLRSALRRAKFKLASTDTL